MGDAQVFLTIDASSDDWQFEADKEDREMTAFTFHHGLYWFIRMPFNLRNASTAFQSVMGVMLSTVEWQYGLVYLNDIVTFSKTPKDHIL